MGLPVIDINFTSMAVSAIARSRRGIVALILRDNTQTNKIYNYSMVTDVKDEDWSSENLDLIKLTFLATPSKVIVVRGGESDANYNAELEILKNMKFNWLSIPGISKEDAEIVSSWIIGLRKDKTFKAILPNRKADNEAIVNFTTEGIKARGKVYTASEYTARIAGVMAALGLDRSSTYYELNEIEDIIEKEDPDTAINEGELILIKQDGKIRIGRGVNSLTTTTAQKTKEFKKIKIIEGMDLIREDIRTTFNDEYIGKVNNEYDNQVLFITAVRSYISSLEGSVLDRSFDNTVDIDIAKQRQAWESIGTDTSEMEDQEIKERSFESNVFLGGRLKFLDAMEDIALNFNLN